jgi:hypothetical protein
LKESLKKPSFFISSNIRNPQVRLEINTSP